MPVEFIVYTYTHPEGGRKSKVTTKTGEERDGN